MDANEPSRVIHHADAESWLRANPATPTMSVVTSLPDVSEMGGMGLAAWEAWFVAMAGLVLHWIPEDGVAIFFQSDIRVAGRWVDKGALIHRAMDEAGAGLIWHKIVCRKPAGTISHGRPSYSHMLCASRGTLSKARNPGPDVLPDCGEMMWSKGMGVLACREACRFIAEETSSRVVLDPFCGHGTVLAVANEMGLDAVGVDISRKRCKRARNLRV